MSYSRLASLSPNRWLPSGRSPSNTGDQQPSQAAQPAPPPSVAEQDTSMHRPRASTVANGTIVHIPAQHESPAASAPQAAGYEPYSTSASHSIARPEPFNTPTAVVRRQVAYIRHSVRSSMPATSLAGMGRMGLAASSAIMGAIVTCFQELRLSAALVREDPQAHLRRWVKYLLKRIRDLLAEGISSPRVMTWVLVLAVTVQLARLGVFSKSAVAARSIGTDPDPLSKPSTPHTTIAGTRKGPLLVPMLDTPAPQSPVSHPLSDGTLQNVASRFLNLFGNSPQPKAARSPTLSPRPGQEVVVVDNGRYIETYTLNRDSSPVMDDPDGYAEHLIQNIVRKSSQAELK
eukprot:GILI01023548.1.p1 GENE.GILI01023548.1~~GILI01023548.1.p1  ORF type:complete len:346 (+),score=58.35 GILI01023548.1:62-1099(+)